MKQYKGINTLYAPTAAVWRTWLQQHAAKEKSVWLIIYKKESGIPSVYYNEAVDEALCFSWIDSKPNKRDNNSFYQFFSVRNPKSNWSAVNKQKVEQLIAANKMAEQGYAAINLAKQMGTWDALQTIDAVEISNDLALELNKYQAAATNFNAFPKSVKRGILEWIFNAKQPATRAKRIATSASLANDNIRANQYVKK
jgi:uncharacterized protein YdeI (YjbR/CyaY-like superfamily)